MECMFSTPVFSGNFLLFRTVNQEDCVVFFPHQSEELKPKAQVAFPWFCLVHSNCNSNPSLITLWNILYLNIAGFVKYPRCVFIAFSGG